MIIAKRYLDFFNISSYLLMEIRNLHEKAFPNTEIESSIIKIVIETIDKINRYFYVFLFEDPVGISKTIMIINEN